MSTLSPQATSQGNKTLKSQELFGQEKQILIEHHGAFYCLRLTKQNKLILTK